MSDVLLATRDVAYTQAATLGWPDHPWVRDRARWVRNALNRDPTLRETPLLPVLLALLASEKDTEILPKHRAGILAAVVRNVVERHEARRDNEFRVGDLAAPLAAKATVEGFASEAAEIVKRGGQCSLAEAHQSVVGLLATRWDLRAGRAEATAEAIVRFWDEAGIFVISGAEEKVAPRLQLFAEIGDAIHACGKTDVEIRSWVEATVKAGRHEPLVLAAGLSSVAADRLLELDVSETKLRDLLHALSADLEVSQRMRCEIRQRG